MLANTAFPETAECQLFTTLRFQIQVLHRLLMPGMRTASHSPSHVIIQTIFVEETNQRSFSVCNLSINLINLLLRPKYSPRHPALKHSRAMFSRNVTYSSGTAVSQWLRCCATNRKVTDSIPDGVIGIFY